MGNLRVQRGERDAIAFTHAVYRVNGTYRFRVMDTLMLCYCCANKESERERGI